MKSRNAGLILCLILIFTGCSGNSGEGIGAGDAKVTSGASVSLKEANKEIASVSSELNSSKNYALEKSELDLLLSEGTITQDQYNELIALAK